MKREMRDLIGHVFKDVTPEDLERERQRMIDEGEIIVHETPFGTLEIKKCKHLPEDSIFVPKAYVEKNGIIVPRSYAKPNK